MRNLTVLAFLAASICGTAFAQSNTTTTLAGGGPVGGSLATNVALNLPQGVAVDASGNVYMALGATHRIVVTDANGRVVGSFGTGVGGYSGDGGPAQLAQFNVPYGVAVDSSGNVYVAEYSNNVIRKITAATGVISTVAGNFAAGFGFSGDGAAATSAKLNGPTAVAVDSSGNIYIADTSNNVVRKVTASTGFISTFAGSNIGTAGYSGDGGPATSALLRATTGVAVDSSGNVYVAEQTNQVVRKITASTGIITPFAGNSTLGAGNTGDGGAATSAKLSDPANLAIDANGNVYIADQKNGLVRKVTAATGIISTVAGTPGNSGFSGDGGLATAALMNSDHGVAVDASGNLYIADSGNRRIRKVNASTGNIDTVAGNGYLSFAGDGASAYSAQMGGTGGVAIDASGNIYITDTPNSGTSLIRKVASATGIITTVAGNPDLAPGDSGDGGPATSAQMLAQGAVAVDSSGNIYIADLSNSRIRKVAAATGIITTIAGIGSGGYAGDGAAATSATLNQPSQVALDSSGNVYFAEVANHVIRKITASTGFISTVAGTGRPGYTGDGGLATQATLRGPSGLALDSAGNIYIADTGNNVVRKVYASTGIIAIFAGSSAGTAGYTGDGGNATSATLNSPQAVAVDASGSIIYIADSRNYAIRKVTNSSGLISTLTGTGISAFTADGANSTGATLFSVTTLALGAPDGSRVIFGERYANRVRQIAIPSAQTITFTNPGSTTFGSGSVNLAASSGTVGANIVFGSSTPKVCSVSGSSTTLIAVGTCTITAFAPSFGSFSSGNVSQTTTRQSFAISAASQTVSFTSVPSSVTYGTASFSVTAASTAPGATVVVGSSTPTICTVSVNSVTVLAVGTCILTGDSAAFSGYNAATQVTQNVVVNPATQVLTFNAPPATVTLGSGNVSLTAASNAPNASIVFASTTANACSVSGSSVTLLAVGTCTINANAAAVGNYSVAGQVSRSFAIVAPTSTTTVLTATPNPVTFGANLTLTANVTPVAATGSVLFQDGATVIGGGPLSNGTLSYVIAGLSTGLHTLTAVYSGDSSNAGSTSAAVSVTINPAPSISSVANSLDGSAGPLAPGSLATIVGSNLASALVTGTAPLGTTLGGVSVTLNGGVVPISQVSPGGIDFQVPYGTVPGSYPLVVQNSVKSNTFVVTIAATAPYVSPQILNADSTPNNVETPALPGTVVTAVLTGIGKVTPGIADGIAAAGVYTPVAAFSATINGVAVANPRLTLFQGATPGFAKASVTVPTTLAVGTYPLVITVGGTASPAQNVVVGSGSATVLTSSLNPSLVGQSVTLTATITPSTATGTVTFFDGAGPNATTIGTATVTSGVVTLTTSALTVGTHSITAVYAGDGVNGGSASAAVNQVVNSTPTSSPTTTVLTSSANPSNTGQSITLTANVSASTATGLVTFFDGTIKLGTGAVSVGAATFSIGSLGIGSHSLTAVYAGDVNFGSSTSSALAQTVRQLTSTTSLVSSANPSTLGQSITLTATVSPATATGTITFNDGTGKLGTVNVVNGTATFSSAALTVGTHSLTASYSGDTNNAAATSAAVSQVVNAATSSTALVSSANPSTLGQSITLTATVSPATATGTITFNDGTGKLGTVNVVNGTAAFSSAALTVGTHSLTASYSGDTNNAATTSSALSQVVNQATTTTSLVSTANPSTLGQSITLSATVKPASATGTITFNDGATKLGTATISNGTASFSSAALTIGTHSLTAVYSGDTNNATSTSSAVSQVVNLATTSTALTSSANPSTVGQSVTLSAVVSPATATGTVTFYDGTAALVTPINPITLGAKATFRTRTLNDVPVALGTVTLTNGKATLNTTALAAGAHALTAVYSGDTNNATSTSSVLNQTVNLATTTTTTTSLISSANPSAFAQNITLTASVLQATATGTITFVDGTTPLGTATLANGAASFSTAGLATGSHSITAVYGGDANNAGSSSAILIQSVGLVSSTISLTASPNPATAGGAITLTASLTPSNSTGTVTFKDGASPLGTANIAGGVATLSGFNLSFGNHNLTAVYSGDANHGGATSAALAVSSIFPPISIVSSGLPPGQVGQPYGPVGLSATGGSSSFRWSASGLPDGLGISSSGSISGTPTAAFTGSVSFTVTDQISNNSAVAAFSLSITTSPLTLSGPANLGSFLSGAPISAAFTPTGGTTPYTFTVSGPAGLSVSSAGQLSGSVASPANYNVTVTVTDSKGLSSTKTASLAVFGITTTSLAPGTTTTAYSATINAAGGAAPYTVTATGLPAGIALSGNTLSGRATVAGSYPVGVKVSEAGGLSATASYTLNITGPGPLKLVSTEVSDATVGTPYSDSVSATGGSTPYTWSQSGGILPAGLTFNATGALTGQPSTPGTYALGVQVTDALGAKAVGSIAINVKPAPLLFSNDGSLPSGIVGIEYPFQVLAASGGVGPYTFGVKGALPAGLTLTGSTLSGTPTQSGDSSFSFTVADSSKPALTGLLGVTATIRPASPDIVLAASSASFAITSGTSTPPSPTAIGVSSSVVSQNIAFSTAVSAAWISVTGAAGTPGVLSVGLNASALSLSAAGSPYKGTFTLTCTSSACAGKSQTISVNLTVTSPPAQLSLGNTLLSFAALSGNPQSSTATLPITNSGGGILTLTSVAADAGWLTVNSFPSTLQPGPGGNINVTADPTGLTAGYYRANIKVVSSGGNASAVATLFISSASTMSLSPSGAQFTLPQGGVLGQSSGSFNVIALGSGSIPYTASVVSGGTWISVSSGSGAASSAGAGTVNYAVNPSAVAALPAGAYYAAIRVSGTGVVNSPQDYQVILNVTPANTPVIPDPQAAGLVLISDGTGTAPASQTITVYASSKTAIPYTASVTTDDGGTWLSIAPLTGSSSASAPGTVTVTANPFGLKAGAYRGQIGFAFGTSVRAVNVTLIVQPAAAPKLNDSALTSALDVRRSQTAAGPICANAVMVPTQTGLVSNFSQPTSWPTPLTVKLFDSCGSTVTGAQIVATFTNGDPPLALTQTGAATGVYSATWTPRKASSQVTVTAAASASGYPGASVKIAGQVSPNTAPVLAPNAAGDVFNPQVGAGLGPGNIIQIYGSGLASQIAAPVTLPLPTQLSGTSVIIGGIESPLFYVSPGQVNAQIPFELAAGQQIQLIVNANGALTAPQSIQLNGGTPSILSFASGATVAQHLDGTLILDSSPAVPGEYVVIYTSGLGATDIPVPSGTASPSNPVARVANPPVLTLNGANVPVAFAGLTPGFAGLYQVNFQLPTDIKTGNYELLLTQSGTVGNKSVLTVVAPAQ